MTNECVAHTCAENQLFHLLPSRSDNVLQLACVNSSHDTKKIITKYSTN